MLMTRKHKFLFIAAVYLSESTRAALPLNLTETALRQHRLMLVDELVSLAEGLAEGAPLGTGPTSGTYGGLSSDIPGERFLNGDWLTESFQAAAKCLRFDIENPVSSSNVGRGVVNTSTTFLSRNHVNELLPPHALEATMQALRALSAKNTFPTDDTFGSYSSSGVRSSSSGSTLGGLHQDLRRGHMPAIVHQTWKQDTGTSPDWALPPELAMARHGSSSGRSSSSSRQALTRNERAALAAWVKHTRPRRFLDAWDDNTWRHLVWTDKPLARLLSSLAPWLEPTLAAMPSQKLIRRVDTMRYLLVWLFGGLYLDADNQRWGGDLHGEVFGRVPVRGAAVGIDPHALGAVARHPLLAHMLLYIAARTEDGERHCLKYAHNDGVTNGEDSSDNQDTANRANSASSSKASSKKGVCVAASAWGHGNELTGPEGWRRVLAAYRRCETDPKRRFPMQAQWPTLLFNQGHCGCWGATPPLDPPITNASIPSLSSSSSSPAAPRSMSESTYHDNTSEEGHNNSEENDRQTNTAQPFGLLIAEGGNAEAAAAAGTERSSAAAAVVSLLPAGRKRKAPNPGSDPRVSSFRLCPQEPGCRHPGCRSFQAPLDSTTEGIENDIHHKGELSSSIDSSPLKSHGLLPRGSSALLASSSSSKDSAARRCSVPPPVSWCVGVHACSAVYADPGFKGGAMLGAKSHHKRLVGHGRNIEGQ